MNTTKPKMLSFELNEDMLALIAQEYNARDIAEKFAREVTQKETAVAVEDVFGKYGTELAQRSLQLGSEYSDRTYEILLETIDHTGGAYKFPLLPQRFLEIAYLPVQELYALAVRANSNQLLRYQINDCKIFKELETRCSSEVLKEIPCKKACLNLIKGIFNYFDFDVTVEAQTDQIEKKVCVFSVLK